MKNNFRQGDVFLKEIDNLPEDAIKVEGTVLAYGETTGHQHILESQTATLYESKKGVTVTTKSGESLIFNRFLEVVETAPLTHQEHSTVTVMPKIYIVGQKREFDALEGWRKVQD